MPFPLLTALAITTLTALLLLFLRLLATLNPTRPKPLRHGRRNPHEPTHLLLVLGSGGHTTELLSMLTRAVTAPDPAHRLDWRDYTHRTWIVQAGDPVSASRAREFEDMVEGVITQEGAQERLRVGKVKRATDRGPGTFEVVAVPRAREVHQGILTAPVSCWKCFRACWGLLRGYCKGVGGKGGDFPDLILMNGPATAVVVVVAAVALRFANVAGCATRGRMRTVYVESFARVKGLSLSGKVLSRCVDRFLVQWPQLERKLWGRGEYRGVLV